MQNPKVSIIMPAYKKLDYFKRAINSVLNQSYTDYEIIVADDSPIDIIKEYILSLENEKIKYFHNVPSLHQARNHTMGMHQARGEYIKILHDDDFLLTKDALRIMVELLEKNPDCDFAHVNNIQVNLITNKVIRKRHAQKYFDKARHDPLNLFIRNTIGAPSVTIFRNYNDTFFDGKLKKYIDTDFYISYLLKHPKIAFSQEYLVAIGECQEQDTHIVAGNKNIIISEDLYLYKKYEKYILNSSVKKNIEKYINKDIKELKVHRKEFIEITKSEEIPEFIRIKD